MKKINVTTVVLLVYLGVMAYIGWPPKQVEENWVQYWAVIVITLGIIGLLRYVQIKRLKKRRSSEGRDLK